MSRAKKEAKLTFIALVADLKDEIRINTIPQFIINFKYVESWAKNKAIMKALPEDCKNVHTFFKSVGKLSDKGFQPKKFLDLWNAHEMEELVDYKLHALGVLEKSDEDEDYN